jgi:hypothetical protein
LVFNEADALRAGFNVVSVIAGALRPLLLTLAGHRLAVEVTLAGERSNETRLARELSPRIVRTLRTFAERGHARAETTLGYAQPAEARERRKRGKLRYG